MQDYEELHFRAFHEINHFLKDNDVLHELKTQNTYAKAIITSNCEYQPLHSDCRPQCLIRPLKSYTGNLSLLAMTAQFKFQFVPGSHTDRRERSQVVSHLHIIIHSISFFKINYYILRA
jgi:hypothetical protein